MFYFLLQPIVVYNVILIAAAAVPAIALMTKVYKSDRLEKESGYLLRKLVVAGILSSLLALVEEWVFSAILDAAVPVESLMYNIILYFGIVAFAEETSKYIFLKKRTWKNPEFNCQYDGVVYAVFVSLGFALWENISYVMSYGFGTAVVRAITAIPGHACFGVFMGVFYGVAKKCDFRGKVSASKACRILAVLIPALLHGAYDYIATMEEVEGGWYFLVFVIIMFAGTYVLVGKSSKADRPI